MANRKAFYDALRPKLGALTQANVVGFELVLDEAGRRGTGLHSLSYILGTAWWESGKTMQPVREAYWKSEEWRRKNFRYYPHYGRGLVQLTWPENYKKIGDFYGIDLVNKPDKALDPELSVRILFDGMERGWFTGKGLSDYIDDIDEDDKEDLREFANARRIVNGTDRQVEIGQLALTFEAALKASEYLPVSLPPQPDVPTYPEPPVAPIPVQPRPIPTEPAHPPQEVGTKTPLPVAITIVIIVLAILAVAFFFGA